MLILEKFPWADQKNMYFLVSECNFCRCLFHRFNFSCCVNSRISLFSFRPDDLPIGGSGLLRSPTLYVLAFVCVFTSNVSLWSWVYCCLSTHLFTGLLSHIYLKDVFLKIYKIFTILVALCICYEWWHYTSMWHSHQCPLQEYSFTAYLFNRFLWGSPHHISIINHDNF